MHVRNFLPRGEAIGECQAYRFAAHRRPPKCAGDALSDREHTRAGRFREICQRRVVDRRHDQGVSRITWLDVQKCQDKLILPQARREIAKARA